MKRYLASSAICFLSSIVYSQAVDITPQPPVAQPSIPDKTFEVMKFGAVADGKTLDTAAIQKAIDVAVTAGGGTVHVPPGQYLCAGLQLGNNLNLHLDKGATLLMSNKPDDYKLTNNRYEDEITANGLHDLAITGEGTIDGQGQTWWSEFLKVKGGADEKKQAHRPFLVVLRNCDRVLIKDVTLTNAPMFHLAPQACHDVTIENVKFVAPEKAPNTDACDPSGWHFLIKGCTFDVGDDCIAIKASGKPTADHASCEDFTITDCTFKHGHGLSIGGQTPGGLKRLIVRDCTFENTDAGIRMKAPRGAGGLVEDCLYENLKMKNVKVPIYITSYYPEHDAPKNAADDPAKPITATTPIWKNITIRNVTAEGSATAGRMLGLAEMPISNILLENVKIAADKPFDIWNCDHITFKDSQIVVKSAPVLNVQESKEITGIDPKSGR